MGQLRQKLLEGRGGDLHKPLAQGEPFADIGPKLVTCLLNGREDLLPHDATKIEDLLRRLEAAGHAALAGELRTRHKARLAPARKPWWGFW